MKALIQFDLEVCKKLINNKLIPSSVLEVEKLPDHPVIMDVVESHTIMGRYFVYWYSNDNWGSGDGIQQIVVRNKEYKLFDVIMSVPE